MEAPPCAKRARRPSGLNWRLWAVAGAACSRSQSACRRASGSSLVDLVGTNPPPADEFDIRRVEFSPGEIRITVRNPQPDDLTIANVNVDDAIVPFTVDGRRRSGGSARARSSSRSTGSRRPDHGRRDELDGIETVKEIPAAIETPQPSVEGSSGTRSSARSSASSRSRSGSSGCRRCARRAPCGSRRSWPSRRAALVPRRRGADRGVRAAGGAAVGARRRGLVLLGVALSFLGMTALAGRLTGGSAATG